VGNSSKKGETRKKGVVIKLKSKKKKRTLEITSPKDRERLGTEEERDFLEAGGPTPQKGGVCPFWDVVGGG